MENMATNDMETFRSDFAAARLLMVEKDIQSRGIREPNVLEAMRTIPRHEFVSGEFREIAYSDQPLPIKNEQTISQPYIVALMAEAAQIKKTDRVLEIGTGSGYSAAVLSQLAQEVYSIETIADLADSAKSVIDRLGYENIHLMTANGSVGWPENAPFDAVVVTAGAPGIPPSLVQQLAEGGRLVVPVAAPHIMGGESLTRVTKESGENRYMIEQISDVAFVPLVGKEGYHM